MLLHICSKIMTVSLTVQSFRTDIQVFIRRIFLKKMVELWFLFSAYCSMKLYICSKFHENIDDRFCLDCEAEARLMYCFFRRRRCCRRSRRRRRKLFVFRSSSQKL